MGSVGLRISRTINLFPVGGAQGVSEFESRGRTTNAFGEGKDNEYAVLFDKNGNPQIGYMGDRHSVPLDIKVLQSDGILTHRHPDNAFGGTLSMTDIKLFSKSNLSEIRAFSKQGQLYSIKATANSDREGLNKWAKSHEKIYNNNFQASYKNALKSAVTPLKSGPHKGMAKIASGTTKNANGKTVTTYKYVKPMSAVQADKYARTYSVGTYERAYKNTLEKFGFKYVSTKAGKK